MADVQIENGEYTRIANVLLEQSAMARLNGTQYAILLTLWRFTYGFQRSEHELSVTFISNATGISTRAIKKELKNLIERNVILVAKENTKADSRVLKFNKNYDTWGGEQSFTRGTIDHQVNNSSPGEQSIPCEGNNSSPDEGNDCSPKKEIYKENLKKIYIVFSHWNEKKIITHRTLTDKLSSHISARLKEGYEVEELIAAIDNYDEVLKSDEYYWTYKWGLSDFLLRGLDKFKNESEPLVNFLKQKGKGKGAKPKNENDEGDSEPWKSDPYLQGIFGNKGK